MFSSLPFQQRVSGNSLPSQDLNIGRLRDHIPRDNLTRLRPRLDEDNLPLLIFVNKGIEIGTHALTLDIIADTCGPKIAKSATFIVSIISDYDW